jgi:hypothetical protein
MNKTEAEEFIVSKIVMTIRNARLSKTICSRIAIADRAYFRHNGPNITKPGLVYNFVCDFGTNVREVKIDG